MLVTIAEIHFLLNFAIQVEFFRVYFNLRDLNLSKFSMVYAYLGAYAYCFGELFLGLCLFGGLRLLGSVEYMHMLIPKCKKNGLKQPSIQLISLSAFFCICQFFNFKVCTYFLLILLPTVNKLQNAKDLKNFGTLH